MDCFLKVCALIPATLRKKTRQRKGMINGVVTRDTVKMVQCKYVIPSIDKVVYGMKRMLHMLLTCGTKRSISVHLFQDLKAQQSKFDLHNIKVKGSSDAKKQVQKAHTRSYTSPGIGEPGGESSAGIGSQGQFKGGVGNSNERVREESSLMSKQKITYPIYNNTSRIRSAIKAEAAPAVVAPIKSGKKVPFCI
ncbi:hypothetical protein Tco_0868931 [Tanacetum coccineum]